MEVRAARDTTGHARKRVARTRLKHTSRVREVAQTRLGRGWYQDATLHILYARNERGPTIKEDNYVDQYHYY